MTRFPALLFAAAAAFGCASAPGPGAGPGGPPRPDQTPAAPPNSGDPAAAVPAPPGNTLQAYGPGGPARFVFYRRDSVTFQLPGGGSEHQVDGRTTYLSLTLRDTTDGFWVEFVLDSILTDPGSPIRHLVVDSATGSRYAGLMPRGGGLSPGIFRLSRSSSLGENIASDIVRRFLPHLPAGGARPGVTWTDTVEVGIGGLTIAHRDRVVVSYEASDDASGLRLRSTGRVTRTGSGTQNGQLLEVSGTGVDSAAYRLDWAGILAEAEGLERLDLDFVIPAVGQTVPVRQSGRFTIRRLSEAP